MFKLVAKFSCSIWDIFYSVFFFNRKKVVRRVRRLNPLNNTRALLKLNPYAAVLKRQAILTAQRRQLSRDEQLAKKRGVCRKFCFFLLYFIRFLSNY